MSLSDIAVTPEKRAVAQRLSIDRPGRARFWRRLLRKGAPDGPPAIAVEPRATDYNAFVNGFAVALERAGATLVPYSPALRNLAGVDAVILHWPNHFLTHGHLHLAIYDLARLRLARWLFGTRLIWIAHNVMPHETGKRPFPVTAPFMRSLSGVIYLSEASRRAVRAHHRLDRDVAELVTVHGLYDTAGAAPAVPPPATMPVGLLSFGLLRPYKNHEELVHAMAGVPAATAHLTIAGREGDADYVNGLRAAGANAPSVSIDARRELLSPADLDALIDGAHGIILPYRDILNSGAAIHALSRGRPVLMPRLGSMPELQAVVGERWLMLYDGAITTDRIAEFAAHVRAIPAGDAPDLAALSWERVERDLADWLPIVLGR